MHPEMNHKALDELINESAHQQSYSYQEEDWKEMAAMLDARDERRSRRKIMFIILSLGLLMALLLGFWMSHGESEAKGIVDNTGQENIATTTPMVNRVEEVELEIKEEIDLEERIDSRDQSNNVEKKVSAQGVVIDTDNPSRIKNTISTNIAITRIETQENITVNNHTSEPIIDNVIEQDQISIKQRHQLISLAALEPIRSSLITQDRLVEIEIPKNLVAAKSASPLSVTLNANPEWSSSKVLSSATRGWRIGGSINYDLNQHWQLNAGIAYSKKMYKGAGHTFVKESGWMEDISPDVIDGKCYVIDIPVSATYCFNSTQQNGWYLQAGMSSYIINSEWYGFTYSQNSISQLNAKGLIPLDEITINDNKNNHWVGVGTFAIGYQKRLNDHLRINIAPYMSVPLTGIGEGQLKLYSTGIRLGFSIN